MEFGGIEWKCSGDCLKWWNERGVRGIGFYMWGDDDDDNDEYI